MNMNYVRDIAERHVGVRAAQAALLPVIVIFVICKDCF